MWASVGIIACGGAVGAILRYGVMQFVSRTDQQFPYATFTVNIAGSFILGILAAYSLSHTVDDKMRLLLIVGILGSFTTFSTFSLDAIMLIQRNEWFTALLYVLLSVTLSLLATISGMWLVKGFYL